MSLFSITNGAAHRIPPAKASLERNVQRLFERNLLEVLDIHFLASEYSTSFGGRIDTLGVDGHGAPVIVEYKRSQNDSVISQGLSYLYWLLDHKAEFEVLAQKAKISITIDWESPRVVCIAESYNKFDLDTADLLPIKIELYRYRLYENNILQVEAETQRKVRISTSQVFKEKTDHGPLALKEKNQYTLNAHLASVSDHTRKLFNTLKEAITLLDDAIIEEPKAKYIAYKLTTNFVDVVVLKDSLKIFLNLPSGHINDPLSLARDLTKPQKVGHWGNGDYEIKLNSEENIGAVADLIRQSYEYNK
ncbi:MAG: DUF5655 domain-containing protein [Bryobacteraceae bacterium]